MTGPASTVTRFCIFCDKERQVHAETGRCQTCGRTLASTKVQSPNGVADAPVARAADHAPEKLVLTETPALRRWVQQTKALSDGFKASAAKAADRSRTARTESEHLGRAATAFAGLLAQIGIEPAAVKPAAPAGAKRWSRDHDACIDCGSTDARHAAHGRCTRCNGRRIARLAKGEVNS